MLAQFIPHGHCYLWKSNLVGLHLISDLLIALSYYSIPITLVYFVSKRKDLPFSSIFLLFATFIISCGTTHLIEIWTLWHPTYWISGAVKAITALISLYTAIELVSLLPQFLDLPLANHKLQEEIDERKQTEKALQESESTLRSFYDSAPMMMGIIESIDREDFRYISNNHRAAAFFGLTPKTMQRKQASELGVSPKNRHRLITACVQSETTFQPISFECTDQRNEDTKHFSITVSKISQKSSERNSRFSYITQDISDRKAVETKITKSLQEKLEEKEVLLKEIHHRVKNNLQVICSLLNLQSRYLKEEKFIKSFKETQNRVKSMALVHEQLYQSENLSQIVLLDYVEQLIGNLFRAYSITYNVRYHTIIDDFKLDLDAAVPCGLIINEIISNALKYAFPAKKKGEITIEAIANQANDLVLVIEDNGIGLPPDFDIANSKSLGLKLVKNLTQQLQGDFEIKSDSNSGTRFEFTFTRIKN